MFVQELISNNCHSKASKTNKTNTTMNRLPTSRDDKTNKRKSSLNKSEAHEDRPHE